jgi:tetratricopeptide (TPR) repeat protein
MMVLLGRKNIYFHGAGNKKPFFRIMNFFQWRLSMNTRKTWGVGLFMCTLFFFSNAWCQSVEELMSQGNGLLSNGAYGEAITVFRKVVSMEPRNFEAQSNLAFAYLQSERYQNAITEYNKAISLEPRNALCWQNLGYAFDKFGKRAKAVEAIYHSIELDPSNIDARMNLAAFHEDAKQYDKAVAQYEAVIKIDGEHHQEAYTNVSRCLLEKGNVQGAKKYLNDALITNGNNADARWQLGNILWKKENKRDDALKQYLAAVTSNPNAAEYYQNYGLLLEDMNKKKEAIEVWKSAIIYTNEALKKEEIQARIDKLEKGESVTTTTQDKKIAREESDKRSNEDMASLRKDLRKEKTEAKRIDAPPPDVSGDIDDLKKNQSEDLDLRKAAKKKAAEDNAQK